MNRIHPLFIILLLFILAISLHVKKNSLEKALEVENQFLSRLEMELKDISDLKTKWADSKKKLDSIIKNPSFEGVSFKQEDLKDKSIIRIENITSSGLKLFINKLLNSYIDIKKLSVQKADEQISITVEIEK